MGDFNSFSTETINNMPSLQMTGKTQYIKKCMQINVMNWLKKD